MSVYVGVWEPSFSLRKIDLFSFWLQEDEDRRKYIEALKAEEANNPKKDKDELWNENQDNRVCEP